MKRYFLMFIVLLTIAVQGVCGKNSPEVERTMRQGEPLIQNKDFDKGADVYSRLATLYLHGDRSDGISVGLQYAANCLAMTHKYIDALEYYVLASKAATETGREDVRRSCLNNIGMIYAIFKDYERGAHYFRKAFDMGRECGDNEFAANALTNLINCLCYAGNVEEARHYLRIQKEFPTGGGDIALFHTLYSEGLVASTENDWNRGAGYLRSALTCRDISTCDPMMIDAMLRLGFIYENMGKRDSALFYYNNAAGASSAIRHPAQMADAYRALATFYERCGKVDSAAFYSRSWIALSDSVFNIRAFNRAKERLVRYEDDIVTRQVDGLNAQITRQSIAIGIITIMLALAVALVVSVYIGRSRLRKAQKVIVDKSEELSRREQREPYIMPSPQRNKLLEDIERALACENIVADSELSIASLAKTIGSNTKYVSQCINETYGKNFKTILNERRVRLACERLADDEYMAVHTLAALAQDVGYISANTFTVAFKRIMGMTPNVYRKLSVK